MTVQKLAVVGMIALVAELAVAAPPVASTAWAARWIAAPPAATDSSQALPLFRREFTVRRAVRQATLRISGLGQFEAHIDGENVTGAILTPGWTDYRKRVLYDTYDVTHRVHPGVNAIGVLLGNGMYNVPATPGRYVKFTGSFGEPKLIVQIEIAYTDGSVERISTGQAGSDAAWKTAPGPIVFSGVYGGEDYDARREQAGWDMPGFRDAAWSAAAVVDGPGGRLMPEQTPPIELFEHYSPKRITHPKAGTTVYDLGQNFAGWPEIAVHGHRGDKVRLIAGELLDSHGLVTQHSANASPAAPNAFTYALRGGGVERWHPRFSYYGFRYVQAERTGAAVVEQLGGRALHMAANVDGHFASSNQLFNRIHLLIDRAILSNMMSVLTDCPHREKLGWLEQTHLAGASLMFNYDLAALYAKMSDDMEDAQTGNGMVPDIAPEYTVFQGAFRDSPEWGSAVILSPWYAYQFYGDTATLRAHYRSMQRYAEYLGSRTKDHMLSYGLGDWYDIGPRAPGESQLTGKSLTATAIYYQDLTALARIADAIGEPADAADYRNKAAAVKAACNAHLFHAETNNYDTGSQTANAMPLVVGLVPEEHRAAVLENLVADIRRHNNHVTAGDVGFHYVVRALTDNGRSDVLYDMLTRTDKPSYGDQLKHGATTLTEAWDANPDSSQNHFMLGHAEEWFYRGLAGIRVDMSAAAGEQIRIEPAVVGDLKSTAASYRSRRGKIESHWTRTVDGLTLHVLIPAGMSATVVLPAGYSGRVSVNGRGLASAAGIREVRTVGKRVQCGVAGGEYRFFARRTQ
jgi:alpha-L-rhamnosidase